MVSTETAAEADRHNDNYRMAWGLDTYYNFLVPNPEIISLEDYAYGLAYTVRFRGQTRQNGYRCFYGVGQHLAEGAVRLEKEDAPEGLIRAWLFHESGELPFGDMPGPAKSIFPNFRLIEKRHGAEINNRFGIKPDDEDALKRWDIRMFLTERRDLMPGGLNGKKITPGFEPFPDMIVPFEHPNEAAELLLILFNRYGVQ